MSPEAIMQLCPDFHSYQQEGLKDSPPGLLVFYDSTQTLLPRLALHKKNGLYYCLVNTVATNMSPVRTQISQTVINKYMDQVNANLGNNDRILSPVAPYPPFWPCLPSISETTGFNPILDPLADQPFQKDPPILSKLDVCPDSLDDEKPPQCSRLRQRPIQPAKQLESELWAARLGF